MNPKVRTDKYFTIGKIVFHYIHYLPQPYSVNYYGWTLSNFKRWTFDIYFKKHVFVLTWEKNHG